MAITWDHEEIRPIAQTKRILGASREEVDSRFFAIVTDLVGAPNELVDESGNVLRHTRSTGSPRGRRTVPRTPRSASRAPSLPAALLDAARHIANSHDVEHGASITAAQLATRMGVALPVATAALAQC
ncbi:hypothetical protein AB0D97_33840 [Streptomyces roseus]|uniref:hypothetical protein n=1 Tax=Streptomyces roseus TaxID=66430 RepID=UPI0034037FF7